MLDDGSLAPDPARRDAVEQAWNGLVTSGPTLFSSERQGLIADARAAWAGRDEPNPAGGTLGEVAHWLAVDAGGLTGEVVDDLESRALDRHRYLEAVGVVGRLSNIDFYARGLGASLPELPGPDDSAPTGGVDTSAQMTTAWVPAVGAIGAPSSLDALPDEGRQLRDLHEPMYVDMREIGNREYRDVLSKGQIEYIAARVSYLNECFY